MKISLKNNRNGITIIALVVTIIVLLLIAGITVITLNGENGIIGRAKEAKNSTEAAAEEENGILDYFSKLLISENGEVTISSEALQDLLEQIEGLKSKVEEIEENNNTLQNNYEELLNSIGDVGENYNSLQSNYNNLSNSIEGTIESVVSNNSTIKSTFINSIYPVGSIYLTTSSNLNTAAKMHNTFGGTWEAYGTGRTLVAYDSSQTEFNSIGKTGGIKTFNNSHYHSLSTNGYAKIGTWTTALYYNWVSGSSWSPATENYKVSNLTQSVKYSSSWTWNSPSGGVALGGRTDATGSSAQSVLQPYIVVYMWRRTA